MRELCASERRESASLSPRFFTRNGVQTSRHLSASQPPPYRVHGAANPGKVEISAVELASQAQIQRDLAIVNVEVELLVFAHLLVVCGLVTLLCCCCCFVVASAHAKTDLVV